VKLRLVSALAAVYLIWGSTFLATRVALGAFPPLLLVCLRCSGGALLLGIYGHWRCRRARSCRGNPAGPATWGASLGAGAVLFAGQALLVLAQQRVASGQAAVVLATIPLWLVLLLWAAEGERPGPLVLAGVVGGIAGVALLIGTRDPAGLRLIPLRDGTLLIGSAFLWASGSLLGRSRPFPGPALLGSAVQLLGGAVLTALAALALRTQIPGPAALAAAPIRAWLGLLYLIALGTGVGFPAYTWLLGVTRPALVGTYAFVNPVVALILGWTVLGEPLGWSVLGPTALILGSVALIVLSDK